MGTAALGMLSNDRGHLVIPAAVLLLAIGAIIGGIYDLRALHTQRVTLQAAANAAALDGATALVHLDNSPQRLAFSARALVASRLGAMDIDTKVSVNRPDSRLEIQIEAPANVRFPGPLSLIRTLSVSSSAALSGVRAPVCMLAVPDDTTGAKGTITIGEGARVTSPDCILHTNRTTGHGFLVSDPASMEVSALHRAAGDEQTDERTGDETVQLVPFKPDPLSAHVPPKFDRTDCDYTDRTVTGHETLSSGVYCGGLTIDGGTAELYAGTYVITGGPLRITSGGRLSGTFVGFYLDGADANLAIDPGSELSLTAPKSGELAGLLFRASQPVPADDDLAPFPREHTLAGDTARRLHGTIYLPGDRLTLAGAAPIGEQADFTLYMAGDITVTEGTHLVINTEYDESDVPTPAGLGPVDNAVPVLVRGRPST